MKAETPYEKVRSLVAGISAPCSEEMYEEFCRQAGISVTEADNMFYEEFGMSGAEIVAGMTKL